MVKHRKPIFVLMVSNVYFPVIGGISTYIKNLSEEISKIGNHVKIIAFPQSWRKLPRQVRWVLYFLFITYVLLEIAILKIKRAKIIVHSHSASFCLVSGVAARLLFDCKTLHTFHSPLDHSSIVLNKLTPHLDNVVYVSNATRKLYRKHNVPAHSNEFIIPGGICLSSFGGIGLKKKDPIILREFCS